jgi:hypothetical protein
MRLTGHSGESASVYRQGKTKNTEFKITTPKCFKATRTSYSNYEHLRSNSKITVKHIGTNIMLAGAHNVQYPIIA